MGRTHRSHLIHRIRLLVLGAMTTAGVVATHAAPPDARPLAIDAPAFLANPATGDITVDIAQWFQDAFPFNETAGLPGTAAFDTTSALVVSGLDIAQLTGDYQRYDVPGDTIVANAAGSDVRMDLVFRIKPGVGNYVTVGTASSGLRRVPTATVAVSPGDGSWWGTWLALPGEFATPGASALHAAWPGGWNPNVWMSARCDTAQINLFPVEAAGVNAQIDPARWMSAYHESDPHLAILGIPHHECFLIDTLGPATPPTSRARVSPPGCSPIRRARATTAVR